MTDRDWQRVHALHRAEQARIAAEISAPAKVRERHLKGMARRKETSFNDSLFAGSFRHTKGTD